MHDFRATVMASPTTITAQATKNMDILDATGTKRFY